MSDDTTQRTQIERAIARVMHEELHTRRAFLRKAGRGGIYVGAALALPSILAACSPGATGKLQWANWPAYIDIDEEGAYPSLVAFTDSTDIEVEYTEAINDNEEFFGTIRPDLEAGNPTGWDLIVVTDWMVEKMTRLGYLQELDHGKLPNFATNAAEIYKSPWYDPGNARSLVWQSGITGIGYNPELTGREITSFDDLFDPAFKGRVGLFSEMRDTMSLALLSMGVTPVNATVDDVRRAQQKLLTAAEAGQFRGFYGNEYYDELAGENLALTVAWGGDVYQMALWDNDKVKFVVPDEGGMLWTDNMVIPNGSQRRDDVHKLMNYWYDPAAATTLSEYVGYFSPVASVPDRVRADADAARGEGDTEWADQLLVIADTISPTSEQLDNVYPYKQLDEAEEGEWNQLFADVVGL